MSNLVKSAARTLDILELIVEFPEGLTLTDISQALDIPLSSMHALVETLVERGYLARDSNTLRYMTGSRFIKLAAAFATNDDLVLLAAPVLDKMRSLCKEAITMSVLDGNSIEFIHVRNATALVQVVNSVGERLPAHATGSGKIMLAYLPEAEIDRLYPGEKLPRITPNTIVKKAAWKRALAEARQRGYAYDKEESEPSVWAVAGCIHNIEGLPLAALSIVVPVLRVAEELIPTWTALIVESAAQISSKLSVMPVRPAGG